MWLANVKGERNSQNFLQLSYNGSLSEYALAEKKLKVLIALVIKHWYLNDDRKKRVSCFVNTSPCWAQTRKA